MLHPRLRHKSGSEYTSFCLLAWDRHKPHTVSALFQALQTFEGMSGAGRVDEATIERASADVSAKVETLFGTEESKLDKNNVL